MSVASSADRTGRNPVTRGLVAVLATVALTGASLLSGQLQAGASPSMQSTGSSFASVAIQQWVGQSSTLYGLNINWQVSSSVIGLNNFGQNQVDFAASDIPYSANQSTYFPNIPYQYMPDVAGGLSFMFNLNGVDGQRITTLVLNPALIDKIFLGEIAKWNDPAIAALNPQLQGDLPPQTIIPVFRSDASGENYLLSDYLLHEDGANFTAAQNAFLSGLPGQPTATWPIPSGVSHPNPSTYPNWIAGSPVGQNGSDNAANYVAAVSSDGAITYVETAYAKEHAFPVASLINASGAAVAPSSLNVATALEAAILHTDLTQDLSKVYTNPLPNAYPLSAYSYLVTPCSPALAAAKGGACADDPKGAPSTFPASKGAALGQFASYIACAGQEKMALLGYSPLPPNLVQEDFNAVGRLNGGVQPPSPTPANCKNPYVDGETPLPGEPAIAGQSGGGVNPTATAAAGGGGAGGVGAAGGAAGAAVGAVGAAGSASGTSTSGVSGYSAGPAGVTVKKAPKGYVLINGKLVPTAAVSGPNKFERADGLLAATRAVGGPHSGELIGWTLLVLAVILGPPLIGMYRRRKPAMAEDGAGIGTDAGGEGPPDGSTEERS
jgi:ABC-type phosphate transport system substrate-binding protein